MQTRCRINVGRLATTARDLPLLTLWRRPLRAKNAVAWDSVRLPHDFAALTMVTAKPPIVLQVGTVTDFKFIRKCLVSRGGESINRTFAKAIIRNGNSRIALGERSGDDVAAELDFAAELLVDCSAHDRLRRRAAIRALRARRQTDLLVVCDAGSILGITRHDAFISNADRLSPMVNADP
jgi:hypothetical protein